MTRPRRMSAKPTQRNGSSITLRSTAILAAWSMARDWQWAQWISSKLHGGAPANFLDVGGGATKERVTEAFKIILSDDNVKAVLINIFGGIVRCDLIAEGVIGAVEEVGVTVPVVVRLEGNNAARGREVLAGSGLNIEAAASLADAAQKVVVAAGGEA